MLNQLKQIKIDELKGILDLIQEKEEIEKSIQTSLIPYKNFNFFQKHIFKRREYREYLKQRKKAEKIQQEREEKGYSRISEIDRVLMAYGSSNRDNIMAEIETTERAENIQDLAFLDIDAVELLREKGIEPKLTVKDKKEHTNVDQSKKRIKTIDDLVWIHKSNYFPEGGIIRTPKNVAVEEEKYLGEKYYIKRERNTIHGTLNKEVEDFNTGGNFTGRPYAIIIPLNRIPKSKFIGGDPNDFFSTGDIELPEGSYILCPEGEELGNRAGDKAKVIRYEGKNVDGYANLLISQLGYKNVDSWPQNSFLAPADFIKTNEIFTANNWEKIGHTGSKYDRDDKTRLGIRRTINRIKILMKKEIDIENLSVDELEKKLLTCPPTMTSVVSEEEMDIFSDEKIKYLPSLYQGLMEIGLEIPKNIMAEVGSIKDKSPSEAEDVLRKRIIGEIGLKKISQVIQENAESIDFDKIAMMLKGRVYDYTTGERKIEFLESMGIQLSEIERIILTDKNLMELYSKIQKTKDTPFSELPEEDKLIVNEFRREFENKYTIKDYFIHRALTEDDRQYFSLLQKNGDALPEDIVEKLKSEILEDEKDVFENHVFNFRSEILEDETLSDYCKRYHEYVEKISELVRAKDKGITETSKDEVPVRKLGEETLEEQSDTTGKEIMEKILQSRIKEFVASKQKKEGER